MSDNVVDTNVWAMVDKSLAEAKSQAELDCMDSCRAWLSDFVRSSNRLVVDLHYEILGEYRRNIKKGGAAYQWLNQLETPPRDVRLVELEIEFDSDGYAKLPPELEIADKSDRKFVAVALAHLPTPPIIDATDTDWEKDKARLQVGGIEVHELCPEYLREKMASA